MTATLLSGLYNNLPVPLKEVVVLIYSQFFERSRSETRLDEQFYRQQYIRNFPPNFRTDHSQVSTDMVITSCLFFQVLFNRCSCSGVYSCAQLQHCEVSANCSRLHFSASQPARVACVVFIAQRACTTASSQRLPVQPRSPPAAAASAGCQLPFGLPDSWSTTRRPRG